MKNIKPMILLLTALFISFAVFAYLKAASPLVGETISTGKISDVDLSFSVIGDVHGNTGKLAVAIKDLHEINPDMDALILNGDTVDQGLKPQYDALKECLNKNAPYLPSTLIKNIGNHDFFDYKKGPNTPSEVNGFIDRYLDFSGEKSVYHDTWVKDYHFISLGSESGNTKELGATKALISEKQLDWLKEKLAENHQSGKPIFVFLHQHLISRFQTWVGSDQKSELNKILSKYPEVILFTSHTHIQLLVNNVTPNLPYTYVHTGAIHYGIILNDEGGLKRIDSSEGLYIEVQGKKVTIKGRDFMKKSWVFTKQVSH